MKLLRLILACTMLLLAASPSYALACFTCDDFEPMQCNATPDSGTRCRWHVDYCETISAPFCSGVSENAASTMLADWQVASVEIDRPAQGTRVVTTPSAVADAGTTPQPAPHK